VPSTAETPGSPLSVTVAVCTRDRPEDLARCLDVLTGVRYPALEILVVDNAPATRDAHGVVIARPGVRYTVEPRPGLGWARNRALAEATGEILAFTDDDVVVDAGWVEALAAVFQEDAQVGAVTGLILPLELETQAQRLFEEYRGFGRGHGRIRATMPPGAGPVAARYGLTGSFGAGANMAFRRRVLDELGGFDPCLGAGTPTRGGEDLEMYFRVLKAGHALVYEPAAVVRHRHRRQMYALIGQMRDHGTSFSSYVVRSAIAYPDERWALARLWAWWLAKLGFRVLVPRRAPAGIMRRLALAELEGLLRGVGRYRRARRTLGPDRWAGIPEPALRKGS
jgi:GT2 family glycosyltransferase